jgi:hypothetical protein
MEALFVTYSLSGVAGIRASKVMLAVALAVHFGYLHPNDAYDWVGSWGMILLALAGTIVDFFGDKVPVLDHALHGLHAFLTPIAGFLAMASGYHGDPLVGAILGCIGGGNAFVVHSAKAGIRAISTATTVGAANPFLSLAEDFAALCLIAIAFLLPTLTALLLLLATIGAVRKMRSLVQGGKGLAA